MALEQSALLGLVESLSTADEGTLMRRLLMIMLQQLVDAEATAVIGAERYEPAELPVRSGVPLVQPVEAVAARVARFVVRTRDVPVDGHRHVEH